MTRLKTVPMTLLLGLTALPLLSLLARISANELRLDWFSFQQTMRFAFGGAAISTIGGSLLGILFGTREFPARRWLFATLMVPIAAPPAFWWIGAARLTAGFSNPSGIAVAALAAGLAVSPVTFLLVYAALRQMPANLFEAARLSFAPITRMRIVLLPLLKSAIAGGFVLTFILLLGESELAFLFGFRTLMTDVVTTFSQTFDVVRTLPLILPLVLTILFMGFLVSRSLMRTLLSSTRGSHGVIRTEGSVILSLCSLLPSMYLLSSLIGYGLPIGRQFRSIDFRVVAVSVFEPVGSAWLALALTLICSYPARRTRAMPYLTLISLLLFCVPAAIYAIGWIDLGQKLGGLAIAPVVAHASRAVALCVLGFAVGYSRLPTSLENAAQLVRVSSVTRAAVFVLPIIAGSLIASSALAAALTYSDRDVASLLLAPGASRLTLNLYLASANAPSSTISLLAFAVLGGAALTLILAAAGPALLWRKRA